MTARTLALVGHVSFMLATVLMLAPAAATDVEARPVSTLLPYCEGDADVRVGWLKIAESTNRACGTLFYHSTAVGLYYDNDGLRLYRPQVWLQSGTTLLSRVHWKTKVWTHCKRAGPGWYWENHFWAEHNDEKLETSFIQEYGPDVDAWDIGRSGTDGSAGKCGAEARAGGGAAFFITVDSLWNVTDGECDRCGTYQFVGNKP